MVTGFLELIIGPAFSGKTSTLISRIKRSPGRCLVLKPSDDTELSGISQLLSHNQETFPALCLQSAEEFASLPFYDWIFIDNVHAFTKAHYQGNILQTIGSMLGKGSVVTCAGLDYDDMGNPLPLIEAISQMADAITILTDKDSESSSETLLSAKIEGYAMPDGLVRYNPQNENNMLPKKAAVNA